MSEKTKDEILGANVKDFREKKGIAQKKLGEGIGVSLQQIQKYENGTNRITAATLHTIANFLKIPVNSFYRGLEDEIPPRPRLNCQKVLEMTCEKKQQVIELFLNLLRGSK